MSIWIVMGRHADWGNCADADSVLLREFSAPLLAGEHWFSHWVPLRRK